MQEHVGVVRPSVVSEPSDASTVKPAKSRAGSRKDSVTGGGYDVVQEGSVASLPIRGITPSMIGGEAGGSGGRSMMSYAMGQRLRPFE